MLINEKRKKKHATYRPLLEASGRTGLSVISFRKTEELRCLLIS